MKSTAKLRSFLLACGSLLAVNNAHAASATWNVDAAGNWVDGSNWTGGAAPGATSGTTSTDVATFGNIITGGRIVTVDANRNIFGINFAGNSSGYTLSGGNLLLTNGGTIQTSGAGSAHTDTISSAIALQGDGGTASFTGGSSTAGRLLVISGGVTGVSTGSNVTTLTLNGTNTGANAISGIIGNGAAGGNLAIVKDGAGTWILSGANTFSGGVTLNAGALSIGSTTALGAAGGTFTINGGTISSSSSLTIANNNPVTINGDFTFDRNASSSSLNLGTGAVSLGTAAGTSRTISTGADGNTMWALTIGGPISDGTTANSLVKASDGTLVLTGANTYTGNTTVSKGNLVLLNSGSYAGDTTVSGGWLVIGHDGALGTSTLRLNGGIIQAFGAARTISNDVEWGGSFTYGGLLTDGDSMSGGQDLTFTGTTNTGTVARTITTSNNGNTTLGAVTYAGDHTFAFGSAAKDLNMTGDVTLTGGNRTFTVNTATAPSTATLVISGAVKQDIAGRGLTKAGTGTLVLSGSNLYTGTTTINAGALRANDGTGLPTGSLLSFNGGVLEGSGTGSFTRTIANSVGNVFWTGNGGFAANGGKLTVNLNGGATIDFGATSGFNAKNLILNSLTADSEVDITNAINLANATRTVQVDDNIAGATDFARLSGIISSTVSANGALTKTGAGTLVLSGANTYTGTTTITAGALRANDGTGLTTGSLLSFNGGVLEGSGTGSFTRTIANSAGNVFWTGNGGFAANGGKLTVNLNSGATIDFGATSGFNAKTLILNSLTADSEVDITNAINLANATRTVQVNDNIAGATDFATLSGIISSTTPASGALTKTGAGTLVLSGANTYAGATTITAGALRANDGTGLPTGSLLSFNGGVLEGSGTGSFTRTIANSVGNVFWTGNGGFAANGGKLTVNLNGGATIDWSNTTSGFNAKTLILNSLTANSEVDITNAINLANATRTVQVDDNPYSTADFATLSGVISSTVSASGALTKTGAGLLVLSNTGNTYTGTTSINGGVLRVPLANLSSGNLRLTGGGVMETSGTITRGVSDTGTNVNFAGSGGFSAFGGNLTINLGGAATPTEFAWNREWSFGQRTANRRFYTGGAVMVFNSIYSTDMVEWRNPLALSGVHSSVTSAGGVLFESGMTREIQVNDNPLLTTDFARFSGVIRDGDAPATNNGIRKTGSGLLELTAVNTYTGATAINGGTLALGAVGSIDNTSGVILGGGTLDVSAKGGSGYTVGNLSGNGTVSGTLTVSTALSIGSSPGQISFQNLTLGASSDFNYEFTGAATTADLGLVSGNLSLTAGATLNLIQLGAYTLNDTFTLFSYGGSLSGTFAGLSEGSTKIDDLGGLWRINYSEATAGANFSGSQSGLSFVNITAIPEPSAAALLGGLGALLLLRRRR